MSARSRNDNEVAVSVIIGTLLLILITVTAASALALMVSQMQKEEMNRQTHQAAVKNEQLKIQYINLTKNNTYPNNWDNASITILNLNTDESRVLSLSVNGAWAQRIYVNGTDQRSIPFNETQAYYDVHQNQFVSIPATQARQFFINLPPSDDLPTSRNVTTDQSIHILVMTSLYNTFEKTFIPPVPVMKISTDTQDLGTTQKTILVLDGSGSSSTGGSIVNYTWNILDNSSQTLLDPVYGVSLKKEMPSAGPFIINLTVTDDSGLTQTSQNTTIGYNPAFAPPTHIVVKENTTLPYPSFSYPVTRGFDTWLNDSSDSPVANQLVTFSMQGNNITLSRWNGVTGPGLTPATFFVLNTSVPFAGVITVSSGKLPPQNVQV